MSKLGHLIRAAFDTANSSRKFCGRSAYVGLLIATTGTTLLCAGGAARSGPCTVQIAQLEQQIRHAASSPGAGPTAPQSVEGLLHHQPTPGVVQNAERKANADVDAAIQRARQADADGNSVACTRALDEAKHHWVLPGVFTDLTSLFKTMITTPSVFTARTPEPSDHFTPDDPFLSLARTEPENRD